MRVASNPVVQFLAAGVLILTVVVLGTGRLSEQAAQDEAIADALKTTELLARSVAEPAIPRGLVDGDPGAIDRMDRIVLRRLLVRDVKRIKIWDRDGTIVYSDQSELISERFELGGDEKRVLTGGLPAAQVSDLSRAENRLEESTGGLLEVYTRVTSPEGKPLLFEVYFSAEDVAARKESIFDAFRPITLGGLVLLLVLTTPLLWVLTRRLQNGAEERERLLRAAVQASDAERRRIARDLHDGVVQDLAGTAFRLSAAARRQSRTPVRDDEIEEMGGSVRASLRALRSLLVEIYPPDLETGGLTAALEDLLAPATGAGVRTTVEVADLDGLGSGIVALVWRVAQESVRNALKHGRPSAITVRVAAQEGCVVLVVHDDGRGFDPARDPGPQSLGLRSLRDLVADANGTLDVLSAPGAGTTVRMEVERS